MWRSDISVATKMVTNNLSLLSILGVPLVLVWSDLLDSTRHFPDRQPQHQQRVHSLTCFGSEIGCCSQHKCAKAFGVATSNNSNKNKANTEQCSRFYLGSVGWSIRPSVCRSVLNKIFNTSPQKAACVKRHTWAYNSNKKWTRTRTWHRKFNIQIDIRTYIHRCSMYIRVNNISLFTTKNN